MRVLPVLVPLMLTSFGSYGDDVSGQGRATIQLFPWGSLYYDQNGADSFQFEPTSSGFRFRSGAGEVVIQTTGVNGFRFSCGTDLMTLAQDMLNIDVQGQGRTWTLTCSNGNCTLVTSNPPDRVTYTRNANAFNIKGSQGEVSGKTNFGNATITSPLGTSTVTTNLGQRTASGVAIQRIPYLGRGFYIPFHGVGVFIDLGKVFPMPEVADYVEWKPIVLGP